MASRVWRRRVVARRRRGLHVEPVELDVEGRDRERDRECGEVLRPDGRLADDAQAHGSLAADAECRVSEVAHLQRLDGSEREGAEVGGARRGVVACHGGGPAAQRPHAVEVDLDHCGEGRRDEAEQQGIQRHRHVRLEEQVVRLAADSATQRRGHDGALRKRDRRIQRHRLLARRDCESSVQISAEEEGAVIAAADPQLRTLHRGGVRRRPVQARSEMQRKLTRTQRPQVHLLDANAVREARGREVELVERWHEICQKRQQQQPEAERAADVEPPAGARLSSPATAAWDARAPQRVRHHQHVVALPALSLGREHGRHPRVPNDNRVCVVRGCARRAVQIGRKQLADVRPSTLSPERLHAPWLVAHERWKRTRGGTSERGLSRSVDHLPRGAAGTVPAVTVDVVRPRPTGRADSDANELH
eukprot:6117356-Prymnesium_polylepis.2